MQVYEVVARWEEDPFQIWGLRGNGKNVTEVIGKWQQQQKNLLGVHVHECWVSEYNEILAEESRLPRRTGFLASGTIPYCCDEKLAWQNLLSLATFIARSLEVARVHVNCRGLTRRVEAREV